jgi:hypothetical protein
MNDIHDLLSTYRRYDELLATSIKDALLRSAPFVAEAEQGGALQIERGVVLPQAMLGTPSAELIEPFFQSSVEGLGRIAVVDRAGHHRPVYRGLLVYACLQAFRVVYETLPRSEFGRWEEGLRPWCDLLEAELGNIDLPMTGAIAGRGSRATEAAWIALALFVAGKIFVRDAWTDLAADAFGRLTRGQQANGALLASTAADNPETTWYDELVLLHAAASYAVQAEDRGVAAAVQRATQYHLNETQPDHATTQPWGVFAFIWNRKTQPLADQVLHAAFTQHPEGLDGVSMILLADALLCLRLFDS